MKLVSSLILLLSLPTTSAFMIEVLDYSCQQRSVTAEFTEFCNNNTCSFGEEVYISGSLNMTDDVVNSWGVSSDSMVYLDSKLHIATYQAQLLTMEPVYLCNNDYLYSEAEGDEEGDDNSNAACPSAGLYDFTNLPLQLPSVPNKVYDWAATGWTGSATIDMYLDENKYQLIGRCQLNLVTHHSNSTSSGQDSSMVDTVMQMVPEAKATGMIIFGTLAALLFLCCVGSYLVGEYGDEDDDDEADDMGFTRMDGQSA